MTVASARRRSSSTSMNNSRTGVERALIFTGSPSMLRKAQKCCQRTRSQMQPAADKSDGHSSTHSSFSVQSSNFVVQIPTGHPADRQRERTLRSTRHDLCRVPVDVQDTHSDVGSVAFIRAHVFSFTLAEHFASFRSRAPMLTISTK